MLTIGLLDQTEDTARQLNALNTDHLVTIVEQPQELAACQLVIGLDVQADDIDALWHNRIVPFAHNLANQTRVPRARVAVLHEPDPTWPAQAQRLIDRLAYAIGDHTIRIDHIGSTSVPGLPAKNLVDIQVVVADMNTATQVAHAATAAGFVRVAGPISTQDRHGIEHPEEVVVDADPGRPTNVNIRAITDPIWRETLCFRDWLRADKTSRDEYLARKHALANQTSNVDEYSDEKIPWISAAADRAEAWATATGWTP